MNHGTNDLAGRANVVADETKGADERTALCPHCGRPKHVQPDHACQLVQVKKLLAVACIAITHGYTMEEAAKSWNASPANVRKLHLERIEAMLDAIL